MDTPDVLEQIHAIIEDINMLTDPDQPRIKYTDLEEALVEDEFGWHLIHDGQYIMFVNRKATKEALHDAMYELSCRFNGQRVHPHRNMGFLA